MAAIYFMGIKPDIPDGTRQSEKRCGCTAQANIQITVLSGEISAACPVCSQEYVVMVETLAGEVSMYPIHPSQII